MPTRLLKDALYARKVYFSMRAIHHANRPDKRIEIEEKAYKLGVKTDDCIVISFYTRKKYKARAIYTTYLSHTSYCRLFFVQE